MRRACKGGSGCAAALRLHECVRAVSVAAGSVIPAPHTKIQVGGPRERLARAVSVAAGSVIPAPHSKIQAGGPRERLALGLFDRLWERYRQRVSYVNVYESIIASHGATFFNDHIALRSLALQQPGMGIFTTGRVFEALGYRPAECYSFEDKHLSAIYFQHPHPQFPKLFISELRVSDLSAATQEAIATVTSASPSYPRSRARQGAIDGGLLAALRLCDSASEPAQLQLLDELVNIFHELPWAPPDHRLVREVHSETQYGAWVLVHGNNVNHFTALINSQGVPALNDIGKTSRALADAGVPMKADIEGEAGSNLRQTATFAVNIPCTMSRQGTEVEMEWPYAYFELAQRDPAPDGSRYEGFFSTQATNLFEMTRR